MLQSDREQARWFGFRKDDRWNRNRRTKDARDRMRHAARYAAHFAAVIESTWIVLVLASSVPMTLTFCPANFSGVRWSLSV